MDIKKFEKTDLHRLLDFVDNIDEDHITIKKEDWQDMCGITIIQTFDDHVESVCLNFYDDGKLRAIITDEGDKEKYGCIDET